MQNSQKKGDELPASELRVPEMASELASAWEIFAGILSIGKKHLVTIDELLNLLRYEGSSTQIDKLMAKAYWLATRFLASNPQKKNLFKL